METTLFVLLGILTGLVIIAIREHGDTRRQRERAAYDEDRRQNAQNRNRWRTPH